MYVRARLCVDNTGVRAHYSKAWKININTAPEIKKKKCLYPAPILQLSVLFLESSIKKNKNSLNGAEVQVFATSVMCWMTKHPGWRKSGQCLGTGITFCPGD